MRDRRQRILFVCSYELACAALFACMALAAYRWLPLFLPRLVLSGRALVSRVSGGFVSIAGGKASAFYLTPSVSSWSLGVSYSPKGDGFYSGFVAWGWSLIRILPVCIWFSSVLDFLTRLLQAACVAVPLLCAFRFLFDMQLDWTGDDFRRKSPLLRAAEAVDDRVLSPVSAWFLGLFAFFRRSGWRVCCLSFGFVCLSGVSVVMDAVGGYFWFLGAVDFLSVLDFLWSALLTILYDVRMVPVFVWLVLAVFLKNPADFRHADSKIQDLWDYDCKVVADNMGTFTLLLGKMRTGKDVLSTMVCAILQIIFRRNALRTMDRYSWMFPWFPFVWAEHRLDAMIREEVGHPGRVCNGVQAAAWAGSLFDDRGLPKDPELCAVLSDCRKADMYWDDRVVFVSFSHALAEYSRAYFIYGVYSSLIMGNGELRTYNRLVDLGHRKYWDDDILHRTPLERSRGFMSAHVVEEDAFRLRKKVDPSKHPEWLMGPAIVYLSEYGKDVGNSRTNGQRYSAKDDSANPLNDGSDWYMKMGGQLGEIDHEHYFKIVANEQRMGAISSDRTDLAQSIWSIDVKQIQEKTALSVWWLEPALLQRVLDYFYRFYSRLGLNREDRTLFGAFVRKVCSFCDGTLDRMRKLYCYKEYRIPECTSDSAGNLVQGDPVLFYDIYRVSRADQYCDHFLSGFFEEPLLHAMFGLFDRRVYGGLIPTRDEFDAQHSYMVDSMKGGD